MNHRKEDSSGPDIFGNKFGKIQQKYINYQDSSNKFWIGKSTFWDREIKKEETSIVQNYVEEFDYFLLVTVIPIDLDIYLAFIFVPSDQIKKAANNTPSDKQGCYLSVDFIDSFINKNKIMEIDDDPIL
jgi:hypothetical protein